MARYTVTIDTGADPVSGRIFAEIYYPKDAVEPQIVTQALFHSDEEARAAVINAIRKGIICIDR